MRVFSTVLAIGLWILPAMGNTPILDIHFSSAEGFSNGSGIDSTAGMAAQPGWYAGDTAGVGYAACTSRWARAKNYSGFTLEVGHAVVVETTLRLNTLSGSYPNNKDVLRAGFAYYALHSGNTIPSVGATLHSYSDGSYWFGGDSATNRINIGAEHVGDWIKLSQVIIRGANSNEFSGYVSATNLTSASDLGSTAESWIQTTTDGSWGGDMDPAFRAYDTDLMVEIQLDRWTVSVTTNPTPPVVTPPPPEVTTGVVHILVDPDVSVSVDGHLYLDRKQFISLSDAGKKFEGKVANPAAVDYYTDDLGMNFGRELGGAFGVVGWNQSAVKEDPLRPGYVDMTNLVNKLNPDNGGTSAAFMNQFSPNLDIATHDRYGAGAQTNGCVPSFMDAWVGAGDDPKHRNAVNADAYGEFVAGILEHGYTDWTRPATYEIVNEPHWAVTPDQRFADIHLAVKQKVDDAGLNVAVGGPCMSVAYFYKNNYQSFGLGDFIDNTGCGLDFYSFHNYDYMSFDSGKNDFVGRVSTGLPVEGVLDMVQNYALLEHGKTVDIVLSEHGGYISSGQERALDQIASTYFPSNSFPGTAFEWEMKRRSVNECLAVRSAIANTMAFMNHPHVVRKAVPFILLESAGWDPRYYSTLLVKENFDPNSTVWHESRYVDFYRYFQDVAGRRVRVLMYEPDIQCHSYADGDKLYILLNNLAEKAEQLALDVPTEGIENITLRRFSRNSDFTPLFVESTTNTLEGLELGSREALAVVVDYTDILKGRVWLDEVPHYADQCRQQFSGTKTFNVVVPNHAATRSAVLRIGVGRTSGLSHGLNVVFNGTALAVPDEDSAELLDNGNEYGSTKIIQLPVNLLQSNNTVQVSFEGGGMGGVGAVVIRTSTEEPLSGHAFGINCAGAEHVASDGTVYQADAYFTTSSEGTDTYSAFGNTDEDPLYKNERYAYSFSYNIPVSNGGYNVTLHMAENWFEVDGARVFDIDIEGVNVVSGLDLHAVAGRANAYDQTFAATVADGSLDIDFTRTLNNAKINAIRIEEAGAPASLPSYSQWVLDSGLAGTNGLRSLDLDGDGFDTWSEFVADTDPGQAGSFFAMDSAYPAGSGFTVSFGSSSNRYYAVEATDNLAGEWSEITNGIAGSGGVMHIIDTEGHTNRFYRVKVDVE